MKKKIISIIHYARAIKIKAWPYVNCSVILLLKVQSTSLKLYLLMTVNSLSAELMFSLTIFTKIFDIINNYLVFIF